MRTFKRIFALSLLLASVYQAAGQFTISGQIRPRSEYRHGYKSLADTGQDASSFIYQRTRLNLGYTSEKLNVGVEMQDIRTWGSQPQLNVSDGHFSIHEAWGEILFSEEVSLKLGRQELVYDDHRILGSVDWAQQARSHDIALFKFEDSTYKAHVGAAFNQGSPSLYNTVYDVKGNYKAMQFLWLNRRSGGLNTSILFMNNGMPYDEVDSNGVREQTVNYSQTAGGRIHYKGSSFHLTGASYYQFGEDPADRELNALYAMGEAGYSSSGGLSASIGYEHLSGTSQTDPPEGENHSFTPFYGTNHKFNGFMDHFYVGNHVNSVGLMDPYVKLGYKKGSFSSAVHAHYFLAEAEVMDREHFMETGEIEAMDPALGTEVDLVLGYKVSDQAVIKVGYSQLFPTSTLEMLEGGNTGVTQNWGWVMIDLTPKFL